MTLSPLTVPTAPVVDPSFTPLDAPGPMALGNHAGLDFASMLDAAAAPGNPAASGSAAGDPFSSPTVPGTLESPVPDVSPSRSSDTSGGPPSEGPQAPGSGAGDGGATSTTTRAGRPASSDPASSDHVSGDPASGETAAGDTGSIDTRSGDTASADPGLPASSGTPVPGGESASGPTGTGTTDSLAASRSRSRERTAPHPGHGSATTSGAPATGAVADNRAVASAATGDDGTAGVLASANAPATTATPGAAREGHRDSAAVASVSGSAASAAGASLPTGSGAAAGGGATQGQQRADATGATPSAGVAGHDGAGDASRATPGAEEHDPGTPGADVSVPAPGASPAVTRGTAVTAGPAATAGGLLGSSPAGQATDTASTGASTVGRSTASDAHATHDAAPPESGSSTAPRTTTSNDPAHSHASDTIRSEAKSAEESAPRPLGEAGAAVSGALPSDPSTGAVAGATTPSTPLSGLSPTAVGHSPHERELPGVASQLVSVVSPLRSTPDGSSSVTVALSPEGLGRVRATVGLDAASGQVTVHLEAESQLGERAIRSSLPDLDQQSRESGQPTTWVLVPSGDGRTSSDATPERNGYRAAEGASRTAATREDTERVSSISAPVGSGGSSLLDLRL